MKICETCGQRIPPKLMVNGKLRKTSGKRVLCYDCSPFQERKERDQFGKIHNICEKCNKHYEYIRKKGHTMKLCGTCRIGQYRKNLAVKYKLENGGKCSICGYSKCLAALHFHHKNSKDKINIVSRLYNRKSEVINKEIEKCILICANCHAEIHFNMKNNKTAGK